MNSKYNNLQNAVNQFLNKKIDRRTLIKLTLFASVSSTLGCIYTSSRFSTILSQNQDTELSHVLNHILPSNDITPGAKDLNAVEYFHLVLLDSYVEDSDKKLLTQGLEWLDIESKKYKGVSFSALSDIDKEALLSKISETNSGESWIATLLTYLFECLLADPVYNVNPNSIGWKWLGYTPGYPRPSAPFNFTKS